MTLIEALDEMAQAAMLLESPGEAGIDEATSTIQRLRSLIAALWLEVSTSDVQARLGDDDDAGGG